jgi:hypothetical protein
MPGPTPTIRAVLYGNFPIIIFSIRFVAVYDAQ